MPTEMKHLICLRAARAILAKRRLSSICLDSDPDFKGKDTVERLRPQIR